VRRRFERGFDLRKNVTYAIGFNAVQIAAIITVLLVILLTDASQLGIVYAEAFVCVAALICCGGAAADIIQALSVRRIDDQRAMLVDANEKLEQLNRTLRVQRHDFMNHLQVVSGLIEMGEHQEASDYIEQVYGDIQQVSRALKTSSPAINALLQAKMNEAEKRKIAMEVSIHSSWEHFPLPGWEMCRVLGNLIDNAMDALSGTKAPKVTVTLREDLHAYRFRVENNGPEIEKETLNRIFDPGVSSKGEGRGMGLFIVRQIIREGGGEIECRSEKSSTVFEGVIPKKTASKQEKE